MLRRLAPSRSLTALGAAAAVGLLAACSQFESGELTARSAGPQSGVNCSSCHSLSLKDSNHVFHLFETGADWRYNGPITCYDCHAHSIVHRPVSVLDTIFFAPGDTLNEWRTLDYPVTPGAPSLADTIRATYTLARVETLVRDLPVPAAPRPGPPPPDGLAEWITGKSHLNGIVDVHFPPNLNDPASGAAVFSPEQETCSSVACHPSPEKPWRFANPLKGLPAQKF